MAKSAIRLDKHDEMIAAELDWLRRRWGFDFSACVAWSVFEQGMPIGDAEYWHGVGWGLLTPIGCGFPHTPLDSKQSVAPHGAHDLEELQALEELRDERIESLARSALGHGL